MRNLPGSIKCRFKPSCESAERNIYQSDVRQWSHVYYADKRHNRIGLEIRCKIIIGFPIQSGTLG